MMRPSVNECKKWCGLIGSFLFTFPLGVEWYWGNMSVYVMSYAIKHTSSSTNVESPWVLSLHSVSGCIGVLATAVMASYLGKRITSIIAMTIFTAGWVGAYFAVQQSLMATKLVVGLGVSMAAFVFDGPAVLYAFEWWHGDVGKIAAFVRTGFTAGAILINQVITFYVNPHNLLPDKQVGPSKFFSQDEVLDKVPSMFLMLACFSLAAHVVGFLLVSENPEKRTEREKSRSQQNSCDRTRLNNEACCNRDEKSTAKTEPREETETPGPTLESVNDVSPKQALRQSTVYIYGCLFVLGQISFIVVCNYYKLYGQLYIKDDHFFTNVSTALLVIVTVTRTFWGWILDRYKLKAALVIQFSGCGLISFLFYFSPMIGKWCYVISTLLFAFVGSAMYMILGYATITSFGKKYFLYIDGLIMLPALLPNLALPPLLQFLLVNWGWFYVFAFCSLCNVIGLFVTVFAVTDV